MLNIYYFEYMYYSSQKISENKTALNCGFGFAIANQIKAAI